MVSAQPSSTPGRDRSTRAMATVRLSSMSGRTQTTRRPFYRFARSQDQRGGDPLVGQVTPASWQTANEITNLILLFMTIIYIYDYFLLFLEV